VPAPRGEDLPSLQTPRLDEGKEKKGGPSYLLREQPKGHEEHELLYLGGSAARSFASSPWPGRGRLEYHSRRSKRVRTGMQEKGIFRAKGMLGVQYQKEGNR